MFVSKLPCLVDPETYSTLEEIVVTTNVWTFIVGDVNVPVMLNEPVSSIEPDTPSVDDGDVVPIPTLPVELMYIGYRIVPEYLTPIVMSDEPLEPWDRFRKFIPAVKKFPLS